MSQEILLSILPKCIRDRNRVWVPEGAAVSGRIVGIRHFHRPSKPVSDGRASRVQQPSLSLKIKLDGGRSYLIKVRYDAGVNQFPHIGGVMARRVEIGGTDRLENSDEGVFDFFDPDPSRIATIGLESNWLAAK